MDTVIITIEKTKNGIKTSVESTQTNEGIILDRHQALAAVYIAIYDMKNQIKQDYVKG